jgi:hypothetical protein
MCDSMASASCGAGDPTRMSRLPRPCSYQSFLGPHGRIARQARLGFLATMARNVSSCHCARNARMNAVIVPMLTPLGRRFDVASAAMAGAVVSSRTSTASGVAHHDRTPRPGPGSRDGHTHRLPARVGRVSGAGATPTSRLRALLDARPIEPPVHWVRGQEPDDHSAVRLIRRPSSSWL